MSLPIFQTNIRELSLLQTNWSQYLNPLLVLPINNSIMLTNVDLQTGDNSINHLLGRKLQGWIVVRMKDGYVQLYDKQSTNPLQDKILVLNSSGNGNIDLLVF
jgi:hypothetical protein